jgi:hypothetical protein
MVPFLHLLPVNDYDKRLPLLPLLSFASLAFERLRAKVASIAKSKGASPFAFAMLQAKAKVAFSRLRAKVAMHSQKQRLPLNEKSKGSQAREKGCVFLPPLLPVLAIAKVALEWLEQMLSG